MNNKFFQHDSLFKLIEMIRKQNEIFDFHKEFQPIFDNHSLFHDAFKMNDLLKTSAIFDLDYTQSIIKSFDALKITSSLEPDVIRSITMDQNALKAAASITPKYFQNFMTANNELKLATSFGTDSLYKAIKEANSNMRDFNFDIGDKLSKITLDLHKEMDFMSSLVKDIYDYNLTSDDIDDNTAQFLSELVNQCNQLDGIEDCSDSNVNIQNLKRSIKWLYNTLMTLITIYSLISTEYSTNKILDNQSDILNGVEAIQYEISNITDFTEDVYNCFSALMNVLINLDHKVDTLVELQIEENELKKDQLEIEKEQLEYLKKIDLKLQNSDD